MFPRLCETAFVPNAIIEKLKPILDTSDALLDTPKTAAQILKARIDLKISQKALAIEMEISQAYLCDLETGKRRWSLALFNFAKAGMERMIK